MAWTKKNSGVVLTPEQTNYLNILSAKLPFDIVVTSGFRTPEKQVRAMFTKIELGDDLIALYRDDQFAQDVIDAYPDQEKGIKAVNDYVEVVVKLCTCQEMQSTSEPETKHNKKLI